MGRTIRSANRNASTPANVIPPDHRTAASGTLPTEHTKLSTAISGPTIAFSIAGSGCGAWRRNSDAKKPISELRHETGDDEAGGDLLPQHPPVVAERLRHLRPTS